MTDCIICKRKIEDKEVVYRNQDIIMCATCGDGFTLDYNYTEEEGE